MKYILLPLLLVISTLSYCQMLDSTNHPPLVDDRVFTVVEEMPQFPGGDEALFKFVQKNIQYPDFERENDIQGRVVVGFVVGVDGSITDVTIKKGVSKGIDAEAIRVIKLMPKFKPGKQQGKAVRVAYIIPIMFKLSGEATPTAMADTLPHPLKATPLAPSSSPAKTESDFIMPEFPGGNAALTSYINDHNKYLKEKTSGKHVFVTVMVTIDEHGKVLYPSLLNGGKEEYNKEAILLVSKLPKFKPAMSSGKPTLWYYIIPVMFME